MVYFGTADGRVNLLYPFFGRVLIGATDIAQPNPDEARCTQAEEEYLCRSVAEVFPGIPITRDHSIVRLELPGAAVPVLCLIGGKWTTFRSFSEQAADVVLARLQIERHTATSGLAIGGGQGFPRDAADRAALIATYARQGGLPFARAEVLLERYGTRVQSYCERLLGQGEVLLSSHPDYAREEILHLARTKRALTVDDILRRRTLISLTGGDLPGVRAEVGALLESLKQKNLNICNF